MTLTPEQEAHQTDLAKGTPGMKPEDVAAICKQAFEDKFRGRRVEWIGALWNTARGDCYRSGFEIGYTYRQTEVDALKAEVASKNVLIEEQQKLCAEQKEWALHTSDLIRDLRAKVEELQRDAECLRKADEPIKGDIAEAVRIHAIARGEQHE